ncbi:MAG: Lrp/AsnC family transcriptional regulator [Sulfuricaulis sp.]|uniref:Lrp/AsnC family transcriptional regulator n=1 Tax=Sulfuricaulis sp. TaxID=2003553 RepID=UPI0025EDCCC6|nr:AsnC family transcriptional regulator [Sulfuricaulis sp.]MCR4346688.1 Lrp/AsnC family transcriptional regulator [Sulfuricaulis sp.]
MDATDRHIINNLQGDFPLCERPYAEAAARLGLTEDELIQRVEAMLENRTLTRFGPMYHAERLGGALTLAAMKIPAQDFERVAQIINDFPEVAHNYARENAFNMWFVLATETPARIGEVIGEIEKTTGYPVYNMPKLEEFFVGLRFEA